MEQFIIEYLKNVGYIYVKIENEYNLTIIYDLFKNNIINEDINDPIICLYYGIYFGLMKNYDLMKKYYFMAIDNNNKNVIHNLTEYYNKYTNNNTINDVIQFYQKINNMEKLYFAIETAFNNNYSVNYNYITDYVQSAKISIIILKHNHKCVHTKNIFMNYKQIMLFLNIVSKNKIILPIYIKLNIMSLFIR